MIDVNYGKRIDEIAKAAFKKYRNDEAAFLRVKEKAEQYPKRYGYVSEEYEAMYARAHTNFVSAKGVFEEAQEEFASHIREIADLRKELVEKIDTIYGADPARLDNNTLELLRSGILKPSEYQRLMQKAQDNGNTTMRRIIAKYAGDAAVEIEKEYGENDKRVMELRALSYVGSQNDGDDALAAFDVMAETYKRATENPSMIEVWGDLTGLSMAKWNELTGDTSEVVESF